jgi:hypothetical protein
MNSMPDIRNHDHADSLLNDYVMGTLSGPDLAWMDEHIPTCEVCQQELPLLLEAVFALPFAAEDPPVEMADDLLERITRSVSPEAPAQWRPAETWPGSIATPPPPTPDLIPLDFGPRPQSRRKRKSVLRDSRWLGLAAAAVLLIGLAAFATQTLWLSGDESDSGQTIALQDGVGNPIGQEVAELEYLPGQQRLVLHMDDMPEAPGGQIYQAWLIEGEVPTPAGIVDPATGTFETSANVNDFDTFAITVEPGPAESPAPTTSPIVVASLHPTS